VGGAVSNLTTQGLNNLSGNQSGLDAKSLVRDSAVGAATGLVPGLKIPGLSAGRGSYTQVSKQIVTKLKDCTISSVRPQTAAKMGAAQATQNLPGAGAAAPAALFQPEPPKKEE
jgi:type VI secretion system secreted protein VgrG